MVDQPENNQPENNHSEAESLPDLVDPSIDPNQVPVAGLAEQTDEEIVVTAETVPANQDLVSEDDPLGTSASEIIKKTSAPPPVPAHFQNLAARGGAITSVVLGIIAILGSFFSTLSIVNAILGIQFSLWGFSSNAQLTTKIGLSLCLVAIGLCLLQSDLSFLTP